MQHDLARIYETMGDGSLARITLNCPELRNAHLCGIAQATPRKPLIGAVEGWALADGFELLLACGLIVAAETARLGCPR